MMNSKNHYKLINILQGIDNQTNINIEETFEIFKYTSELLGSDISCLYNYECINSIFCSFNNRDESYVHIDYMGDGRVTFRNTESIHNNLSETFEDDYVYTFRIEITKKMADNKISIYSSDDFKKWLKNNNTLSQCYEKYKNVFSVQGQVFLELLDDKVINFSTRKMTFLKQNEYSLILDRDKILEKRKDYCFVSGDNISNLIPEDFYMLDKSDDKELNLLFDKLCLLSVLTFIVDISEFKDEHLNYKLYGYKTIQDSFTLENIEPSNLTQLFKIYRWIYHSENHSNISDKLGITRNLLTLHMKKNTLNKLEGDVFAAIKSNFDIYLKENVQRYLEVKNQVSEFIHNMSIKAESHSENFVNTIKNSLLIFISYFLSVIVVTAIDKEKFVNVFTFEVTTITIAMLIISWTYRKYTVADIESKTNRFKEKYQSFKERYADIIEPDNFKALFSDDKDHKLDLEYINNTVQKYNSLWVWATIILGIIAILLCLFYYISDICKYLQRFTF